VTDVAAGRTSWLARARSRFVPPLEAGDEARLGREIADSNTRRLLLVAPVVLLGHVIHVAIYRVGAAERATLDPRLAAWRDAVTLLHEVTFLVGLAFLLAVLLTRRTAAERVLTPAVALVYLVHGAATAGVDQLSPTVTGVAPFIAYCLFFAVFFTLRPVVSVALYGVAGAVFFVALATMQPSASVRLALMPNGGSIVVVSLVLSWLFYAARRREFGQRAIIDRQRESMAALNLGLEKRVNDQVGEITKRAAEVEQLNAQLHAQVRERSIELALALAKLSRGRAADGSLQQGVVLGERFEVGHVIGRGGMGMVYDGVDRTTGASVAVKVIHATSTHHLAVLQRFLREARAGATVDHAAVVRVLHVDVDDDGLFYQVQELVAGAPLRGGDHRWTAGAVARFGAVLCEALAAAHDRGIVHRDVKPSNVMLTRTAPGLKLLDFGIAQLYEDTQASEDAEGASRTGAILGTPAFMSPEQLGGMRTVTPATDVYAVGVILFLLLTGKHPFERTHQGVVMSQLGGPAPEARSILPSIPPRLSELVARALEPSVATRPAARELGLALGLFADEGDVPALDALIRLGPQGGVHPVGLAPIADTDTQLSEGTTGR
jgi:serine/threonine-protein kinase